MKTMGKRRSRVIISVKSKPGVRSWYRFKIPPAGTVELSATNRLWVNVEGDTRGRKNGDRTSTAATSRFAGRVATEPEMITAYERNTLLRLRRSPESVDINEATVSLRDLPSSTTSGNSMTISLVPELLGIE